jgi:hypothetical protein
MQRAEVQITVAAGEGPGTADAAETANAADAADSAELVFDWAVANNMKLLSLSKKRYSLEDVFLQLTAGEVSS